jgi:hypothetical protein
MWGMAKCTIKGSVLLPQTVNRHLPRSPRQAAAAAAATGYLYLVSSTYLIYPCLVKQLHFARCVPIVAVLLYLVLLRRQCARRCARRQEC